MLKLRKLLISSLSKINTMLGNTHGLTYMPTMTKNRTNGAYATFKYNESSNSYGLKVTDWRHSYDTNIAENNVISAVIETSYFMYGYKQVAYALWS